jgi:hypothetical protein
VWHGTRFRTLAGICLLAALARLAGNTLCAQEPPDIGKQPPAAPLQREATNVTAAPCIQPAPMVRLEDYSGPLKKAVGTLAQPLERKAVPLSQYRPGVKLCTLRFTDKFVLFVQDSTDMVTFLGSGFSAGLDQAENADHTFGQGAQGYGKRFGAEFADRASSRFFRDFAYPWMFSEDPRYYRLGEGHAGTRLLHAAEHAVVAHRDSGKPMFNFSVWLGTASSVVLSNTYHPDNQRGFASAAQRVAFSILQGMGADVLREFWPQISRKLKLPFRGESLPVSHSPNSATP